MAHRTRRRTAALASLALLFPSCTGVLDPAVQGAEFQAQSARLVRLEREADRLRADLKQAEEALIAAESGIRRADTRADAVSALADARIDLQRATEATPWRKAELHEAAAKLAEADRQLQNGHLGATNFFASRAQRIARALILEAETTDRATTTRWVGAANVNLRDGPSTAYNVVSVLSVRTPVFEQKTDGDWSLVRTPDGLVGWVHRPLLQGSRRSSRPPRAGPWG